MILKDFCRDNGFVCKNCMKSYWNYISENRRVLFCENSHGQTEEDYVCIHYCDENQY